MLKELYRGRWLEIYACIELTGQGCMPVDGLRGYMPVDGLRGYMRVDRVGYMHVDGAVYMYISRVTHRKTVRRIVECKSAIRARLSMNPTVS